MVERAEEIYQTLLDSGISEKELTVHINEKEAEFQVSSFKSFKYLFKRVK